MTSHELARKLLELPNLMVTRNGYEGGVEEITTIDKPEAILLNQHEEWYYGKHEYYTSYNNTPAPESLPKAIHIA